MPPMPTTCPRCSRANPADALFCFADGAALGASGQHRALADPARARFPRPFVFPSGQACHSFDELVLACFNDWKGACSLLKDNSFTAFLAGLGRADLARFAREAARERDADMALDGLINRLPSSVLVPPRLQADPAQLNLGTVRPGKDITLTLRLQNAGLGLLTGTADCSATPWLFLGKPGAASKKKVFQLLHDQALPVLVEGRSLQAGKKPLTGNITFETNGGQVVVPVSVDVPILPFPDGPLAGCTTPRQIAEKALALPREVGESFSSGAVARWFASNGWAYPVKEAAAAPVAAIQQFFEALGLSRPPKVTADRSEIFLEADPAGPASEVVALTADTKQPVWALVECSSPWLDVREVIVERKSTCVRLGVTRAPDQPGESGTARVVITTNGRVKHAVTVRLKVRGQRPIDITQALPVREIPRPEIPRLPPAPVLAPPVPPPPPPPPPSPITERPARRRETSDPAPIPTGGAGRPLLALAPVLLVLLGLGVTLGRDLGTWMGGKPPEGPGAEEFKNKEQAVFLSFHDREREVTLAIGGSAKPGEAPGKGQRAAVWEPSMRFGLSMEAAARPEGRRLTFDALGLTNNCVVRLDGREVIFGERPFRDRQSGNLYGDWPGRWVEREARMDRPLKDGRKSVWRYDAQKVEITQTVGLVIGEQTGRVDTCLVHYRIDNKDGVAHDVGIRFLLDTFIGQNDGVPFLIPGHDQLCSTQLAFNDPRDVPDFIQACEREDLANPGTIAQLQLKLAGMEPPSRVTLGAWPNPQLGVQGARQEKTLWLVPLVSMKSMLPSGRALNDSAVAMYWGDKKIMPGGSREVAFAYGLGSVSSGDTQGRLALTAGGSFTPRGEFTLTAYVRNPAPGQTLKLQLPEGFERIGGDETARVPPLAADAAGQISPVTWRVKAGPSAGSFPLKVTSSTGVSATQNVAIKVRGIFGS